MRTKRYVTPIVEEIRVRVQAPLAQSVTNPGGVAQDFEWGGFES